MKAEIFIINMIEQMDTSDSSVCGHFNADNKILLYMNYLIFTVTIQEPMGNK